MSTYTDASLIVTPNAKKAGKLYALKGADLNVVRATTATYVGSDGLIKTALANEVRFDYTNGSCPSILVEPQRTNLLLRSEEFNVSPWGTLGTITITPNSTIAPDGNNTADLILGNNASSSIYQIYSGSIGVVYTSSFFIKNNNSTQSQLLIRNASTVIEATLNWTGSVLSSITNTTGITTFQSYNNGWYRIMSTYTSVEAAQRPRILPTLSTNQSVYIWGAQLEAGANATSYIPTVASTVTRNSDVISKTGISDLIGQTEGTVFFDLKEINNKNDFNSIMFSNGTDSFRFGITTDIAFSQLQCLYISTQTFTSNVLTIPIATKIKIAIKYSIGELKFFANGSLISTFSPLNDFSVNNLSQFRTGRPAGGREFFGKIDNILLWKTKLTDEQCIALTTL